MPRRSNRGGARTGVVGTAYPNRTDLALAPVRQAAPIPAPSAPQAPQQAPPGVHPLDLLQQHVEARQGAVTGLGVPSERPAEPLTAGLPTGPGPGPEALTALSPPPPSVAVLAALNAQPEADSSPAMRVLRAQLTAASQNRMVP